MTLKMVSFKQMTPKKVYFFLLFTMIFALNVSAQTNNVLFLGVFDQKGEHVEPPLEQALRQEFSVSSKFRLIGGTETQRYLKELERIGATPLERVIPPKVKTADSAITVWAVVKESSMRAGRHILFWGKADARLTVEIFICDLKNEKIYYRGELSARAIKSKGFLFVLSARKNVHISAADRSELKGNLQSQTVKSVNDIFSVVFDSLSDKNDNTRENYSEDSTDVSDGAAQRIPSVTDMFAEPSVDLEDSGEESGAEQPVNGEQTQVSDAEQTEPAAVGQSGGMEAEVTVE
jgi:hypothetical protein